jgi:hypothetical protein
MSPTHLLQSRLQSPPLPNEVEPVNDQTGT